MLRLLLALLTATLLAATAPAAFAQTDAPAPWRVAQLAGNELAAAQQALIIEGPKQAAAEARKAERRYERHLRRPVADVDAAADRAARSALSRAVRAAEVNDRPGLAAARGGFRAAILQGSFAGATEAARDGDAAAAAQWLLLREFRTATRFTRPGADATLALRDLRANKITGAAAEAAITKDLLDAYQARTRELIEDAVAGDERELPERRAEASAQAAGYFTILGDRYAEDRGKDAAGQTARGFARMATYGRDGDPRFAAEAKGAAASLRGFTAAPFTDEEAARRAQQLLRFLALVPVEYDRGVSGRKVTADFEIQEAVAFIKGATSAFGDLQDQLAKRDGPRTAAAEEGLAELSGLIDRAARTPDDVNESNDVTAVADRTEEQLTAAMPEAWTAETDESDYDLIALTLDRMEAAASAGQFQQAEQARLEAYAFFEFGPERRLKAFDQGLALDVEGLIWFGAGDTPGLAKLIADRAPRRDIRATRQELDQKLLDSAATLGDSASKATVVTNSAIIVFREGLEGVLILAAITASFVKGRRKLRRPVLYGAAAGLIVSILTFILAITFLKSLEQYGEKLEAVVGLIAIAVLLLITNWFFHRVYWSEWIGKFHRQRKKLETDARIGFLSAQAVGLFVLGLTSVYREGFETVLFLQALQLSAGTATVVEGAGLGLAMTLGVAVLTFALQRKLPYKKMLVVTGVLIGFVLIVMVGQTARTMQGTGWISITTLDVQPPYWLGLWFGVYPTVETIGAQVLAAAFVIGSYFLARELRVKGPVRRSANVRAAASTTPDPAPVSAVLVEPKPEPAQEREKVRNS